MKLENFKNKVCPKCGKTYTAPPATSRIDGTTRICPDCGTREALASLGVDEDEQERIIKIINKNHKS